VDHALYLANRLDGGSLWGRDPGGYLPALRFRLSGLPAPLGSPMG